MKNVRNSGPLYYESCCKLSFITQGSDDGSFHDANETPVKDTLSQQQSSADAVKKYLDRFKEKVYGAPDNSIPSPAASAETTLTPKSRGQALLGKLAGFFSPNRGHATAAAGSPMDLDSPLKKMVDDFSGGASDQQLNKGAKLVLVDDSDDENSNVVEDNGNIVDDSEKENANMVEDSGDIVRVEDSPVSGEKTNKSSNRSSIITVDDTPSTTPVSASNKFLQQALSKAKKGSENSPISVENTPAVSPQNIPSSLDGTPVTSKRDHSAISPRRPLENISNSPKHSPGRYLTSENGRNDKLEDDFYSDLPPATPRHSKKNKRRSVCALPTGTPRRVDEIPVSPSGK